MAYIDIETEPYISITSIPIDDALYEHTERFQTQYDELLRSITGLKIGTDEDASYNFDAIQKLVDAIPLYRKHYNIGKFGPKRHPDNFAFIIAALLRTRTITRWADVIVGKKFKRVGIITGPVKQNEFDKDIITKMEIDGHPVFINTGQNRCICDHDSNTVFLYKSMDTEYVFPVGTSCVKKYQIATQYEINEIRQIEQKIKEKKQLLSIQRRCADCNKRFIFNRPDETLCFKCFGRKILLEKQIEREKQEEERKQMEMEDQQKPITNPPEKQELINEIIQPTHSSIYKDCEYCNARFKPRPDRMWARNCIECYIKHSKPCMTCHKKFLPSVKAKAYATICSSCYKKSKMT
jgi:hypothetical protein